MKLLLSATVGAVLALSAVQADADRAPGERQVSLRIESKTLAEALDLWAQQSGVQIIVKNWSLTKKFPAPKLNGTYDARAALDRLLDGSPLTYDWVSDNLVTIREKLSSEPPASWQTIDRGTAPSASAQSFIGDGFSGSQLAASNEQSRAPAAERMRGTAEQSLLSAVEEIVVTGTHIRGGAPVAPLISIRREDIQKAGNPTLEYVLQQLPQNFAALTPAGRFAFEGGSVVALSNEDRASSVDLRGLGAQSTLTLLNGTRRAGSVGGRVFDISTIPLAMIERIDVVTGAHSAVYGADAVGGVVNLISRRNFEGLETELSYGSAERGGGERLRLSQIAGITRENAGIAVGYEYGRMWPFDLADVGLLTLQPAPSNADITQLGLQVQADTEQHSAFLSGHYDLNDSVRLRGDALYSHKQFDDVDRSLMPGATDPSFNRKHHPGEAYGASIGMEVSMARAWTASVDIGTSANEARSRSESVFDFGFFSLGTEQRLKDKSTVSTLSGVLEGPLPSLLSVTPRVAVGMEARREKYSSAVTTDGVPLLNTSADRDVRSAFAELALPLVENSDVPGLDRLELSIAARYDDYSDFGNTSNPQFGLVWAPVEGLAFKGAYSHAFRAPALVELADQSFASLMFLDDPQSGGVTPVVTWGGSNPELGPEKAKSWSIGLEWQPPMVPATSLALSLYDVKYARRVEAPAINFFDQVAALSNEDRFPGLLDRTPDPAALAEIIARANQSQGFVNVTGVDFADCPGVGNCNPTNAELLMAFPNVVVFDNRTHNIASDHVRGLDLLVSGALQTGPGAFEYGLNATYTLEHERHVTATSPSFEYLNEVGKPVDVRARLNLGWTSGALGVYGVVNYVDDYADQLLAPQGRMSSWTTADLVVRFDGAHAGNARFLSRTRVVLAVENAFDRKPPPFVGTRVGVRYDSVNASPFGRYWTLSFVQAW